MRNRFDRQLEELNEMLIHMGELCETAIEEATGALEGHDIARAKAVITADSEIDQMEKEIENLCLKLLLQQQPVARDLRRISASLKMITDMERIGDQTADIADIVIATKSTEEKNLKDINRMAEATVKMVRDSVSAYVQKDLELARRVMAADDEVDDLFDLVKGDLVKFISDHKGSAGDEAIDLIMIAKYLERIGDHAADISEMTILMAGTPYIRNIEHLQTMAKEAMVMLVKSIEAYVEKDLAKAEKVIESDDVIDDLFDEIKAELIDAIHQNPDNGEQAADLLMVSKYLERIGDHATNIAEWVIFSITGNHPG